MSEEESVERVAKALWDLHQGQPYIQWGSNYLMFGSEWNGKSVPWDVLMSEHVISSVAEDYREKARVAINAYNNQ